MKKQGKYVTKSIRLTEDEARDLAALVEEHAASESALMRQWVLRGMQQFRIEQAVAANQRDEVDARGGAALAGLPVGAFIEELGARRVALLEDPEGFERGLEALRNAFGRGREGPIAEEPGRKPRRTRKPAAAQAARQ